MSAAGTKAPKPKGMESESEENKWQPTKLSVTSRLFHVLQEGIFCDVFFIVGGGDEGEKECMPAHRLILSLSSSVFAAMFNGPIVTDEQVVVTDVHPKAFRALLKYIYTDEFDLNVSSVMSTLYAAKKYQLPALETACEEFLMPSVCSENAVLLLSQAILYDEKRLIGKCIKCIDEDAHRAFKVESFTEIKFDLLCTLLARNTLNIKEIDLYHAVKRWAAEECKRRKLEASDANERSVVGKAISLIRFPAMSGAEFAAGPAKSDFLTKKEKLDVMVYFFSDPKPKTCFRSDPRKGSGWLRIFSGGVPYGDFQGGRNVLVNARTRLSSTQPLTLKGIGIYGATTSSPCSYTGSVSLMANGYSYYSKQVSFTSEGSTSSSPFIYYLRFDNPVAIQANTSYIVTCSLSGPDFFVGSVGDDQSDTKSMSSSTSMPSGATITFQYYDGGCGYGFEDRHYRRLAAVYVSMEEPNFLHDVSED